jgi:membrane-bound lytic murein transglycosylase MltF
MATPFVSHRLAVLVVAGTVALASMSATQRADGATSKAHSQAVTDSKPWTGDFDGMLARGRIRMLVPYSRTLFYVENGKEHGLTADLAHDFETYLNQRHAKELKGKHLTVALIPTTRDKLLSGLTDGMGDISGGNLTATPARTQMADFVAPTEEAPTRELLISSPGAPAVPTINDLSGRKVNVRQASSYLESLNDLNDRLGAVNRTAVQIVPMPDALEDEDVLELLNAGLFDFTVVDSWKAKLWAQTVPNIRVHDDIVLRSGGMIGWAIRKQSPKLQAEIEGFYKTASKQGLIEARLANYQARLKEFASSATGSASSRLDRAVTLFRNQGKKYAFDPLMLTAEGFTQSGSHTADAAAAPQSGVEFEQNVAAATKYLDNLMSTTFPDAKFSDTDRTLFAFASYKAGAENIARMRTEAAKRGLDPNVWFNNVEQVTAEKMGMETTAYVRSILKYDVAYKLINEGTPGQKN